MMYNDVDNDLPPFNDTIDGEEIFLFSNTKTSSTGASFLHDDDGLDDHLRHHSNTIDDHLRHHNNAIATTSAHHHHHHLPVDVDELLLNSNFLEQPNCDQSEDPLFWNCKDISDDQLNEFLPQAQLHLNSNNIDNNCVNPANNTNTTSIATTNFATNVNNTQQNTIVIGQQSAQNVPQIQHSQTIIPIHQLQQTQQQHQQQQQLHLISPQILDQSQQIHHQQIRLQQQQGDSLTQLQQPITSLQNLAQFQPNITIPQQSGFQAPQQIIQHVDQYHSKWITLVQTNEQYQSYTTPSSLEQTRQEQQQQQQQQTNQQHQQQQQQQHQQIQQFFDKIPQTLIQTDAGSSSSHNQLGAVISTSTQPIIIQQPQTQNLQQAQIQLQIQQQQAKPQQLQQLQHQQVVVNQPTQQVQTQKQSIPPFQKPAAAKPQRPISQNDDPSKKEVSNTKLSKSKEKQISRLDCPYCKRSFSKNFDLQQHMRCHTGEKPFQCIVCGRGFAQKSNVKKHMQAHKVWPEGPNNPPMPSNHSNSRSRNNSASSSLGTPRDDECMQENDSLHMNDNNNNINNNNNGTALGLSNDRKQDGNDIFAENRYSCSYCQFNGKTYFELKSHLTIHKREKVFKCIVPSCGKTFSGSDLQGFLDHVTGHKDLIYHCHLCSGQFYSLDEFGEHQKHHSSNQSKRTTQSQTLSSSNGQSQVNVSNQRQTNNASLRQQNQQVTPTQLQPQQNQRQYNQQQITPTQQQQLNNQKQNNSTTTTTTTTTNGNNTKLFNNNTNNNNNSRPSTKNNNQKFFRCSKCMNRYTTQTALDHHISISTHNFPCTECNKVFMCERYLRRHMNTHTAVHHVCSFCDKQFKTASYLKMHSVVHTGEKPFRCNQCEAAFNRRDKLNRHKLTHETIKKFKCPFKPHIGCTKEFNRPDKLKAHVLTHSGVRPHPCDSCSRTFSRLSRLREHKKLHHSNDNNNNNTSNNNNANNKSTITPKLSGNVTFVGATKHQHVQTSIAPQQLNLSVVIGIDNGSKMNGANSVGLVKKE